MHAFVITEAENKNASPHSSQWSSTAPSPFSDTTRLNKGFPTAPSPPSRGGLRRPHTASSHMYACAHEQPCNKPVCKLHRLMKIALLLLRARSCSGCMEQPQPASSRNGSSRPMTWFMLSTCRPKHVKPHALHHLAVRLHQPTCQKRWPPPAASLLWSAATAGHAASRIPGCSFASTGARRHMFARASTPITVGCPVNTRWVRALGGWR